MDELTTVGLRARMWRSLPAICWAAATLVMATSFGSHQTTRGFLLPFLVDTLGFAEGTAHEIHHLLRKAGHVVAYAFFAVLLWIAFKGRTQRVVLTIVGALALACLDEFIQSHNASRGGKLADVLLDGVGVLLGVLVARKLLR